MARDDDDFFAPPKSASVKHTLGETLDAFSLEELDERIALLRGEIDRIEAAMARKRASRDAASTFFKSGSTS
jgi:uncharacterized small protein (DUF1192 family)